MSVGLQMQHAEQHTLGGHDLSTWEQMSLWGYWLGTDFLPECYLRPKVQNATGASDTWEFRGLYATGRHVLSDT
jgi:hypothetical protein